MAGKPLYKIALPERGLVVTSPQRSGKTTLMYAYMKEIASRPSTDDTPKILVICDPFGHMLLKRDHEEHEIPLEAIQMIRMGADEFPDAENYETVVFAITLNANREAYYKSSAAYEAFVAQLNDRHFPPYTMILVDSD